MLKITIYEDYCPTLTAYKTISISSFDTIAEISVADWAEYQRIERQYAEWQGRLEGLAKKYKGKEKHEKPRVRKNSLEEIR